MGEYLYYIEVRMSEVDLVDVYDAITITIRIKPCVTTKWVSTQQVDPLIVYFGQDIQTFKWNEFE